MTVRHFEALTWLRGFAAFFVVVSHSIRSIEASVNLSTSGLQVVRFFDLGNFGVYLFFALSGCTLFLSNSAIESPGSIVRFYFKRFMRIWPAFFLSLGIFAIFDVFYSHFDIVNNWIAEALRPGNWKIFLVYLSLGFNFTGPGNYFNSVYWSVPIEFQYYLLFPLAVLMMRRTSFFLPPLVMAASLYLIGKFELIPVARYEFFTMAYAFFGGMLLADLRRRSDLYFSPSVALPLLFVTLFFVAAKHMGLIELFDVGAKFYGLFALLCVLIAISSKTHEPSRSGLLAFLSNYGNVSYSTYLFHMIFVGTAVLVSTVYGIEGAYRGYFVVVLSICASYLFSQLTYKYVEQSSIRLGRNLILLWDEWQRDRTQLFAARSE